MWDKLTVRQFQDIIAAQAATKDSTDLSVKILSILHGITETEVDSWSIKKFNEECKKMVFLSESDIPGRAVSTFKHKGRKYHINYRIEANSYGQYNELMMFSKDSSEIMKNLDRIMASIITPMERKWWGWVVPKKRVVDHVELCRVVQEMPVTVVYHCAVFFYHLFRNYLGLTRHSLEKEMVERGMSPLSAHNAVQGLLSDMDGCIPPMRSPRFWGYLSTRSLVSLYKRHSMS